MATNLQTADSTATNSTCWSCGAQVSAHFCAVCGKVQPATAVDYFSFFSLPRKLNIELPALEREFYRLSRQLHPDLYARASAPEQQWSLEKTSLLNDAYRTLRDPIARTEYLLKLEGVQLEEQSKAATDRARQTGEEKKQVVPADLLEEVFELNMQLEELRLGKKIGEADPHIIRDLQLAKSNFEGKQQQLADELRQHWERWDALMVRADAGETVSDAEFRQVRDKMVDVLNRRTYIRNLVRDVNEALEVGS
jgi:molecular chaperone HscB